jgi:hypothetical protein
MARCISMVSGSDLDQEPIISTDLLRISLSTFRRVQKQLLNKPLPTVYKQLPIPSDATLLLWLKRH